MKKTVALCFILTSLFLSTPLYAQDTVEWSRDRKLNWSDFKAAPNLDIVAYALTSYKIEILPSDIMVDADENIQDYEALTVVANFYKEHSWVYEKSAYLLLHEQLHFDIAALYALKIQAEFEKLKAEKNTNYNSYVSIYQELWAECLKTQTSYDKETQHGQLVAINDTWIDKINEQINAFEQ
ncbi:DUF922 domain-containing protein [Winogradskyella psychrotolerans]|uniref:DUF922 domain-containing protein n=1 Tax=Winogradskyella psychrotolerans TaxID=1344585 RepID=UPI001C07BDDA|nr:DUF922 domain-containing protein [Winogradskyella psychrotolerans]MBU2927306.1 DUF922 domain-containing protein [Winogradskyella psychrotolerans]